MKRLYIATPINSLKGDDLAEKKRKAQRRIKILKTVLADEEAFKDYELFSTFDLPHDDETSVEVHAAGTAILPDCCTPDMLTTAIVELMRKEPVVADILRSAVRRYDEIQMPPRICLN